jgi:hypothetical protein
MKMAMADMIMLYRKLSDMPEWDKRTVYMVKKNSGWYRTSTGNYYDYYYDAEGKGWRCEKCV